MKILVSSSFGLEAVTKRELLSIGIDKAPAFEGRLHIDGDFKTVAEVNMFLRTAERVHILLGEFTASTFDELFDNLLEIKFEEFIGKDGAIVVNAKSRNSVLFGLTAIQSVGKKAIVNRLMKAYNINTLTEEGARYNIELSFFKDNVMVSLDTSGMPLHKRGYRDKVWTAPIKETMASALIMLSVWNKDRAFIDPFCGSGTIPIEAALIGSNIAPGINRKFAFEDWDMVDKSIIEQNRQKANDLIDNNQKLRISGFDIDSRALALANYHAEKAKVKVHFETSDMRNIKSKYKYGVIVTNPPYGERISDNKEIISLYKDFGTVFSSLDDWSAFVIVAHDNFEKCFNRKADRNRKMYNGSIECRLYSFLGKRPPQQINN